jgi:antirestriction protein ArdC
MSIAVSFENLVSGIKQQLAGPLDEWRMPWHNGVLEPYNPISGHIYTGNNAIALIRSTQSEGYTSAKWAELSDWSKSKRKVQKGSVPTKIHRPIFCISTRDKKIDDKRIVGFKLVKLFNGDQIEAHEKSQLDLFDQFQNKLLIDDFIGNCNANIHFHDGNAYYNSECDSIFIPHRKNFPSSANAPADHNYYATIIHELIHWTGHLSRLNRSTLGGVEHENIALEELIAELGTALICARFDNQIQPRTDHAAYLKYWLKGLDEELYFGNAFKQAQEAIHYLYQLTGNGIHPLSYNPVKENDGHLEPESHEESEEALPIFEQGANGTQQQNAETESVQAPLTPFVRTILVNVQCLNCTLEYDVTLMRYEAVSICPGCFAGNHHRLVW